MKFDIARSTFLEAVQKTLGIAEKRTTMPILNNILIKGDTSVITIAATDREISLVASFPANVKEDGEITVSAKKLYEMIRETQGETINFEVNEQCLVTMACDKVHYRIPGITAEEFPHFFAVTDDTPFFPFSGRVLHELIRKTSFAMSVDETRKNFQAVFLETTPAGEATIVRMVATDGHRLAMCQEEVTEPFLTLDRGILIPRKGVMEIRKFVEEEEDDITIGVHQEAFAIRTSRALLKVSLLDAKFPDYRKIVPAEEEVVLELDRLELLHALRRMNVMSSDRYSGVIMSLAPERIVLNSNNPDVGEANDELIVNYTGKEITVGYNVNFLLDAIEVIDEDTVQLRIGVGVKPTVVKPAGKDHYCCMIMPLSLP